METKKNFKKNPNKKGGNKKPMAKKARPYVQPTEMRAGRDFEYKMSPEAYADIVAMCKKENGGDAIAYACHYINEQYGLLGNCVGISVG